MQKEGCIEMAIGMTLYSANVARLQYAHTPAPIVYRFDDNVLVFPSFRLAPENTIWPPMEFLTDIQVPSTYLAGATMALPASYRIEFFLDP